MRLVLLCVLLLLMGALTGCGDGEVDTSPDIMGDGEVDTSPDDMDASQSASICTEPEPDFCCCDPGFPSDWVCSDGEWKCLGIVDKECDECGPCYHPCFEVTELWDAVEHDSWDTIP